MDEAREAFYYGIWYLKVHGSCGAIDIINKIPYQRYNSPNKDVPINNISMKNGCQPSIVKKEGVETHKYSWKPFERPSINQKSKQRKYLEKIWKITEEFCNQYTNNDEKFILVEFCGDKFQKTPNITQDVVIVEHLKQEFKTILDNNIDIREPELVKKYLLEHAIEGFICSHPITNTRYKIRSNMFFDKENCLFEKLHQHWIKNKTLGKFKNFLNERDYPLIYSI